jgi:hypothetical protein
MKAPRSRGLVILLSLPALFYSDWQVTFAPTTARREGVPSFEQALAEAKRWFFSSAITAWAADPKPIRCEQHLVVCPILGAFSVALGMQDNVELKRLSVSRSVFESRPLIVNYQIISRFGNMVVSDFNGQHLSQFVRDVLEAPAKRGNQQVGARLSVNSLTDEELRKRRKTVNCSLACCALRCSRNHVRDPERSSEWSTNHKPIQRT